MFNGLDEIEDFAARLAPLTSEEQAAAKRKQEASVQTDEPEIAALDNLDEAAAHKAALELGSATKLVSEVASETEAPLSGVEAMEAEPLPEPEPQSEAVLEMIRGAEDERAGPAIEKESAVNSNSTPVYEPVPEIKAVPPDPIAEAIPALAHKTEPGPGHRGSTVAFAKYVAVGGLLSFGLLVLLL
ncbi:hypothetical protein ACQUQP_11630 [Marinobacterium sp. YM272]|uniref:hypothetical protein n=1 Tax=Marinobacterium sp. YM272 TaxID=3421654 RepID=UPI003D7F9BED